MRPIDADEFFRNYPELAIEPYINAPTVEAFTEEDIKQTIKENFDIGYEMAKNKYERPQGEWNEIQAGMLVCPFCGARPHKDYKNFCAKCGADMRGDVK